MKTKKKRVGGFRLGAGRKPFLEKPRRITVVLNQSQFDHCKQQNDIISIYVRSLIDRDMQKNKSSQMTS